MTVEEALDGMEERMGHHGCGDNGCMFHKPPVGTNGFCRCLNSVQNQQIVGLFVQQIREALGRPRDKMMKGV